MDDVKSPVLGQIIEVRNYDTAIWNKRLFVALDKTKDLSGVALCVGENDEYKFHSGLSFRVVPWTYWRPVK